MYFTATIMTDMLALMIYYPFELVKV